MRSRRTPWAENSMTCSPATFSALATIGHSTRRPSPVRRRRSRATNSPIRACSPAPGSHGPNSAPGSCSGKPVSHAMPDTCSIVMANPVRSRHGPVSPNAGIRTMIEPRVDVADLVPRQPERLHHPRAVVLDHHVALGDQPAGQVAAGVAGHVDRDAALVRVRGVEVRRALPPLRHRARVVVHQPGAVGAHGRLDVDDVGAEHAEHVGEERAGPERREVGDAHAVERARAGGRDRLERRRARPAARRS